MSSSSAWIESIKPGPERGAMGPNWGHHRLDRHQIKNPDKTETKPRPPHEQNRTKLKQNRTWITRARRCVGAGGAERLGRACLLLLHAMCYGQVSMAWCRGPASFTWLGIPKQIKTIEAGTGGGANHLARRLPGAAAHASQRQQLQLFASH
jgi:hypothetical protein